MAEPGSSSSSETGDLLTNQNTDNGSTQPVNYSSRSDNAKTTSGSTPGPASVDLVAIQLANILNLGSQQVNKRSTLSSNFNQPITRPGPQFLAYSSSILLSLRAPSILDGNVDVQGNSSLLHSCIEDYYDFDVSNEHDDEFGDRDDKALQPHIYDMALKAYFYLRRTGQDQALLFQSSTPTHLSGQSELRRLATRALLSIGSNVNDENAKSTRVSKQIQAAEFIIDAFGCIGANSSMDVTTGRASIVISSSPRFGRYSELQYSDRGRIIGYKTLLYGLDMDTHRIGFSLYGSNGVQNREKSFHALRWLVAGSSVDERSHLRLPEAARSEGSASFIEDRERFGLLKQAFKTFGFPKKAVASLCSTLAAILHISSLEFGPTHDSGDGSSGCEVLNTEILHNVASLLGLLDVSSRAQSNLSKLAEAFTSRTSYIDGEKCTIVLNVEHATEYKDVVAKSLYRLVWEWLGEFVNQKLSKDDFSGFIALVDFPSLSNAPGHRNEGNTLATLCMNLASERLAGFISTSLYPQASYDNQISEGLPANLIPRPLPINSTVSETIRVMTNMPGGLVHIIDDQALRKGKNERTCLDAMGKRWGKHKNFNWRTESDTGPGSRAGTFTIEHWSDSELITYSTENFLEKNLNIVPTDLVELLGGKAVPQPASVSSKRASGRKSTQNVKETTSIIGGSSNPFVRELFANEVVAAAQSEKVSYINRATDIYDDEDQGLIVPGARAARKPSMKRNGTRRHPPLPGVDQDAPPASSDPTQGAVGTGLIRKKSTAVRRAEVLSKRCFLGTFNSSLNDLLDTLNESCRMFFVFCLSPSSTLSATGQYGASVDIRYLKSQIKALQLHTIRDRCSTYPLWMMEFDFKDFWNRYSLIDRWQDELISKTASMMWKDKLECVREEMEWNEHEFAIGKSKVFLNHAAFRQIEDHLRSADQDEQKRRRGFLVRSSEPESDPYSPFSRPTKFAGDATSPGAEELVSPFGVPVKPYNHPAYAGSGSTAILPLVTSNPYSPRVEDDEGKMFINDDEFSQSHLGLEGGLATLGANSQYAPSIDMFNEQGATEKGLHVVDEKALKETIEIHVESSERKHWKFVVWCFTWWIPSFLLSSIGRMKRPDVRMTWREKVTIFMLIACLCGAAVFVIVFLGNLICPKEYVYSMAELSDYSYANNAGKELVAIRGEVFDLGRFANIHYPSIVPTRSVQKYGGLDATSLFPVQVSALCNGKDGSVSPWVTLDTTNKTDDNAVYHDFRAFTNDSRADWYWEQMVFLRYNYRKGFIGYTKGDVEKRSRLASTRNTVIYKGNVYDMSNYISNSGGGISVPAGFQAPSDTDRQFMHEQIVSLFQNYAGQDITNRLDGLNIDARIKAAQKICLRNLFFVGKVDSRNSVQCQFSRYILLAFSVIMVAIIGFKFIAALQFGRARQPENHDRFVILQVPCYTEGEDSLRECIESLASLKYDDKRKLLFVICDGMIIGSGNDRPTPRIVLDILGADPALDPEPLSFLSLGEGAKQHNMGKVYSGLYEHAGHVIPYIVLVKVGKPNERSRPGNRGKRDSQMILMRFMNRVHFDSPMSPCELEIYHQIKNVIGVNPTFYEFLLAIDADTVVDALSLNRFISAMVNDRKVIATCGETELANAKKSMISMIQVYEYFISHHLAKAFESLFGSVTCLPGCFSLYRLRSMDNKPIFIANDVVRSFGENRVDTLHMKNLLHLGEDRYLTTLLLKNFPSYKLTFTKDAHAKTIAPEDWKVLLSQRRRWINSTIHNLVELIGRVDRLCGFCCCSMRAIVFIDLLSTLIQPITVAYLVYLIYLVAGEGQAVPTTALIMLAAVYGLQALIFLLHRKFEMIVWMVIYILAIPIFSFLLPVYSFWRQDDFSWGQTRVVLGEKGKKLVIHDEGKFDECEIPLKTWHEYENELWEQGSNASIGQLLAEKEEADAARYYAAGTQAFGGRKAQGSIYGHESVMGLPSAAGYASRPRTPMSESGARGYQQALNSYRAQGGTPGYPAPGVGLYQTTSRAGSVVGPSPYQSGTYASPNFQQRAVGEYELQGHSPGPGTSAFLGQHQRRHTYNSVGGQSAPLMPGQELSDEQLDDDIRQLLARADLQTLTKKGVREKLEQMYGIDLTPRKAFINAQIEKALSSLY